MRCAVVGVCGGGGGTGRRAASALRSQLRGEGATRGRAGAEAYRGGAPDVLRVAGGCWDQAPAVNADDEGRPAPGLPAAQEAAGCVGGGPSTSSHPPSHWESHWESEFRVWPQLDPGSVGAGTSHHQPPQGWMPNLPPPLPKNQEKNGKEPGLVFGQGKHLAGKNTQLFAPKRVHFRASLLELQI